MNSVLVITIIVAISAIVAIISIFFLGKDNPVEEACEDIIKKETGLDIDLSPDDTSKKSS